MGRSISSSQSHAPVAALEERIHYVSEAAVKKKWKKLPTKSQEDIVGIITSVKSQQSINSKKHPKKEVAENDAAIEQVATRLGDRLPRMLFPPAPTDEPFDFEHNLHRIQSLEMQLAGNTDAINLLQAQIKKEEHSLSLDEDEVKQLQDGLRSNAALRRQQTRKLHPAVQQANRKRNVQRMDQPPGHTDQMKYDTSTDPALSPLLRQLNSHLNSMWGNTETIRAVLNTLDDAAQHLSTYSYKHIITSKTSTAAI